MADVQNLSELAAIILSGDISGFSQDNLDELYATHDDPNAEETEFDADAFVEKFERARSMFAELEENYELISGTAKPFFNLYTLWAAIVMNDVPDEDKLAQRYLAFMTSVGEFQLEESTSSPDFDDLVGYELWVARYKAASVGATTDEPKRRERLEALQLAIFADDEN